SQAFWIFAPAVVLPIASIVVIAELPMLSMGVMQERVAAPSICTVQAPHSAMPQPNFVPVMPSTSRNTQSNGVSPSTSTACWVPLTVMVRAMASSPFPPKDVRCRRPRAHLDTRADCAGIFRARRPNGHDFIPKHIPFLPKHIPCLSRGRRIRESTDSHVRPFLLLSKRSRAGRLRCELARDYSAQQLA